MNPPPDIDDPRYVKAMSHPLRVPAVSPKAWADASPVARQAAVVASLDTIAEYARAAAATGGFDTPPAHLARAPMRLDPQAWQEASVTCQDLLGRLGEIAAAAWERLEADPHRPGVIDASAVLLLFESLPLTDSSG